MKKFDEAAALHFGAGFFKEIEVGVAIHDLSRVRLTLIYPEGAMVQRGPGSEKNGREATGPGETVSLAAALLFIQRLGVGDEPQNKSLWMACIKEASEKELKPKALMPPLGRTALIELHEALPPELKPTKKTSAQRVGVAGVKYTIERLTKESFLALA